MALIDFELTKSIISEDRTQHRRRNKMDPHMICSVWCDHSLSHTAPCVLISHMQNGLCSIRNKVIALFFMAKIAQRFKSCRTLSLEFRSAWFISSPFLALCYLFGPTPSPAVCGDRPGVWGLQSRAGRKSTVKLVILLSFTGGFVVKTQCNWNRTPVVTPHTQYQFHGQR